MLLGISPVGAEYHGRLYYIERPRLSIDLSYQLDTDERQGPYTSSTTERQYFTERFNVETQGWVYHPALMTYKFTLSPEWQQSIDQADGGGGAESDSFFLGYSLDMNFLQNKPYNVTAFASNQRTTTTTSLATTTETESSMYGATLWLNYKVLPTSLSVVHTEWDQSGFFLSQETSDEARLNMRHTRPGNETFFNGSWIARERTTEGTTIDAESFSGVLQNLFSITADNRATLSSTLAYNEAESNRISSSSFSIAESIGWRHSSTFSTNYNLGYSQNEFAGRSTDNTFVSAGLSHSLYENLTTSASISASSSSIGVDDYGGNLSFNYQRRIPWGMLNASMSQDYRVTTRSTGNEMIQVVDEPHTLTTGDVTLLVNRYVVLTSVVVTSLDRSVVYLLDIDYTLEQIGSSVRISRTTFGAIPNGGDVLVSYVYVSSPAYDSSNYAQSYGVGVFLWDVWRINYGFSTSQEDFITGTPPDVLSETTSHRLDTELIWDRSRTRFLYEDIDTTTGVSTTRWRLEENLTFRPFESGFLDVAGYYGQTTLKDQDSEETFYGARANLQWRVNRWSKARLEGFYGYIDGRTNQTESMGALAGWEWFYGIWGGDVTYRILQEEDRISNQWTDRQSFYVTVRRALF